MTAFIREFWLPYKSVSSAKIVFSFYSYTVFLRASLLSCSALYELLLICFVNKVGTEKRVFAFQFCHVCDCNNHHWREL